WCPPCRAFNPELVKIYKKYHKMGLEIVGVSLDRDHDAWLKGIKDDKLTWYHVSDLKYWQSEVGKLYNVNYIPQNTFVDAEGNIIGRKVAEDEIEAFLDEHLK
ncbi:MAG TPA: TlpA family protein disulfide reductase, partial [Candidatus Coprenecus stercorigallinarum]|nr:TlpA family protein disulfide reductase [Candidatus Coprenecus stercorigallinarum]